MSAAAGYPCPLRVFFLRTRQEEATTTYGSMSRSGWIIGKATILFHVAPHMSRGLACTYSDQDTRTFDHREVYSATVIRKRPTRRERENRMDAWAHTDNGFLNIKQRQSQGGTNCDHGVVHS